MFSILGILLIIGGGLLIGYYFMTKTDEYYVYDKPFVLCEVGKDEDDSNISDTERTTYGKVKRHVKDTDDIVGFDFFPDDNDKDIKKISNEDIGLVAYFSNINRQCSEKDINEDSNSDQQMHSVSYVKASGEIGLVILGGVLCVAGFIQLLISLFKKSKKKSKGSSKKAKAPTTSVAPTKPEAVEMTTFSDNSSES